MPEIEIVQSIFGLTPAQPGWTALTFTTENLKKLPTAELRTIVPSGAISVTKSAEGITIISPVPVLADGHNLPAGEHHLTP